LKGQARRLDASAFYFQFVRAGHIYSSELAANLTGKQGVLVSHKTEELGACFIESWKHWPAGHTPKLQLLQGNTVIGENNLPEIPWDQAHNLFDTMSFLHGSSQERHCVE
jgi:hypothetical protein